MKYKEFIQAVDSLTNDALVSDKEATPWKVDIDDQDVKVVNQKTGRPLLKISKHIYGAMLVYQLTDSTSVSIFEEAVLLNETPLESFLKAFISYSINCTYAWLKCLYCPPVSY